MPTLIEQGIPLEISAWFGLVAPAGAPPAVITWLNQETNKAFSAANIRDRYVGQGAVLPLGTPEAFGVVHRNGVREMGLGHHSRQHPYRLRAPYHPDRTGLAYTNPPIGSL